MRRRGDGALFLRGVISPSGIAQRLGSHRKRDFDLVLSDPVAATDVAEIDLGPFTCPAPPRCVRVSHRLLQFTLKVTRPAPGKLRISRRLLLLPGRVAPKDYAEFREALLAQIDVSRFGSLGLEGLCQLN